jgi:hypothetical protein
VGDWYWIGLTVGIGAGCGVFLSGLAGRARAGVAVAALLGAAAGAGIGFAIDGWEEAIGGAAGGIIGALAAAQLVRGALRRGGTRGGTATILAGAGLAVAALALVPALGYLEAFALPLLSLRLRGRAGARYAGLRILARD